MHTNLEEPDRFEDLEYLGKDVLKQMSEKEKIDMRRTKRITRTLDWIAIAAIGISAIGFGAYKLAPEKTQQLYNNLTNFYQIISPYIENILSS